MPSVESQVGASYTAYVPDDGRAIDLGWTDVRIYWGSSEEGSYSLVTTIPLVSGQRDYTYVKDNAALGDYAYHTLYNSNTSDESLPSVATPVGPRAVTRAQIRKAAGALLGIYRSIPVSSVTSASVFTSADLIDPDASAYVIANRWLRDSHGEGRRIRAGSTGYAVATGELTLGRAFTNEPSADDVLEMWEPRGLEIDPSAAMDAAIQRCRTNLWWEDTYYFSTDDSVSEYFLPRTLLPDSVKYVQYAADSYPDRPGWTNAGWYQVTMDGGLPLLSVLWRPFPRATLTGGTVMRVVYNQQGGDMLSDTDSWAVPLEWAAAEAALEFMVARGLPRGGKEDVSDYGASMSVIQQRLRTYRGMWLPPTGGDRIRVAR